MGDPTEMRDPTEKGGPHRGILQKWGGHHKMGDPGSPVPLGAGCGEDTGRSAGEKNTTTKQESNKTMFINKNKEVWIRSYKTQRAGKGASGGWGGCWVALGARGGDGLRRAGATPGRVS